MDEMNTTIVTPGMVLRRHDGELDDEVYEAAVSVINTLPEEYVGSGKAPSTIAASAIWFVVQKDGRKMKQKEIAEMLDVDLVSLRLRHNEIAELV